MVYTKRSVVKEWLDKDASIQRFNVLVGRKRLSPTTRRTYVKNVKRFVDYVKAKSPVEALEKFKQLSMEDKTQQIDDFVKLLLDEGMNTTTAVQLVRGGFKKWLTLNGVEVDWTKIQAEILPGEETLVVDRMPSKEELKQLLNVGSLRDRAMLLILTSSGLRIGALCSLTLADISLGEKIPRIVVKRQPRRKISRKMKAFATFITPEAKAVLQQYIEHRKKQGEKVTDLSPLLTSDRQEELGNFLSSYYLSNHWRRLLRRTHLATKNGGPWNDIHLHTLRKYFETQCTNASVKTTYREFWMGHTGRFLEESYFRGEVETHVEEYRKAIPYLNILSPEPSDYKTLLDKVRFLEENGKRKESEIQELHAELETRPLEQARLDKVEKELEGMRDLIKKMVEKKKS